LTQITIPEGVTTIERDAFRSCDALSEITIPSSVTTIENSAFYERSMKTVTCLAATPPTLGIYNHFGKTSTVVLHVPAAGVDAYKADERWSAAFAAENIRAIP
jgi:hypothetical protein